MTMSGRKGNEDGEASGIQNESRAASSLTRAADGIRELEQNRRHH